MFNLLAITSRSGELARKIRTLSKEVEDARSRGSVDEWKQAQLDEAKIRQAALNEQFEEWDVSLNLSGSGKQFEQRCHLQVENSLRRHNHVGLVRML